MKQLFLFFSFLFPLLLAAQIDSLRWEEILLNDVERQTDVTEESVDCSAEAEWLWDLQDKKININQLDEDIAFKILGLSDFQYYHLLRYIDLYGELVTLYELAAIEGFDTQTIARILNKIEAKPCPREGKRFAHFFQNSQSKLLLRYGQILERQAGYDSSASSGYAGSPSHLAFKYTFQSGDHFAFALAGEKDAGEQFFRGAQKQGFDHYAFYVNFKQLGILRNLVVGDYTLDFGQGLVVGGRRLAGKGGGTEAVRRFPGLLRAVAPMNEGTNFRGIAATIGNTACSGTVFYSHRFFDGQTFTDTAGTQWFDASLSNTGYHRTETELANRRQLAEHFWGGHLQTKGRIFECGVTATGSVFTLPVAAGAALYKKYAFAGKSVANVGADYKVIVRKAVLWGEMACSVNQRRVGFGVVQGLLYSPHPRCKTALLFRYYGRNYVALNASAISSGSSCQDEAGLYFTQDFTLGRAFILEANADFSKSQWLRYKNDHPATNFDLGAKLLITPARNCTISVKYQFYQIETNSNENVYYASIATTLRHRGRICVEVSPADWLRLKTEADVILQGRSRDSPTRGLLFSQDMGFRWNKIGLRADLRLAFFDGDSYADRIYAYEQDLLYAFTIASYYGKGLRYYCLLSYQIACVDFQVRFAQTFYDDRHEIGSGNTHIQGQTKSELRAQMIFHIN